jgi:lipoyl synthase
VVTGACPPALDAPPTPATAADGGARPARRLPSWLRATPPGHPDYVQVKSLVGRLGLHTVCESARCPNIGECWGHRTATFLILGDVCTRNCAFCAIRTGTPAPPDDGEPEAVAAAVAHLELRHAVVTSVTRDDLADGGAAHFARTLSALHRLCPRTTVEVLVPDFAGNWAALGVVLEAEPDILNHNIETVPRLYPTMRPQARYDRSLELLHRAGRPGTALTKSGLMLGAGEQPEEVVATIDDLRRSGCQILTLGQYLSPSAAHAPVARFVPPDEFERWREHAAARGFTHVEAGPLVRSSYRAQRQTEAARARQLEDRGLRRE